MIAEFSIRPKARNKRALYLLIALIFAVAALIVLYIAAERYKGLIGLAAMVPLVAAVFLYTKYVAASYSYDILIADNTPLFTVRQIVGKRDTTLCRVQLGSIVSVEKMTAAERKAHKTPSGFVKYSYCPTLGPEETYLITYSSRYEKAEITVEISDEFAALLLSYAAEARENYVEDEF